MTGCEYCPAEDVDVRQGAEGRWVCDDCYYGTCPPDCENTDMGNCPRCYANTGMGCDHGVLCLDCKMEIDQELHEKPCDYCFKPMDWEEVERYVSQNAPWDSPVPRCHRDCAELAVREE